ncbi:MAG TPA: hypothetical protein EYP22_06970 [Methanosarcinales archaeon]|nr:hypothetical protein [Methanosarcinales archaeon]
MIDQIYVLRKQKRREELKPIYADVVYDLFKFVESHIKNDMNIFPNPKNKKKYPDAKLLNRERKVVGRVEKEKIRKGTKDLKKVKTKIEKVDVARINKIICGDSEVVLKDYPANFVDIIITSPPYNFGLEYEGTRNKDAIYWQDYFDKLNQIWKECYRVLKHGGRFCVNIQPLFSDYMPTHHIISKQLLDKFFFGISAIL